MEIKEVNSFIVLQKLLFFIVVQNRTEALKRADYSSFYTKYLVIIILLINRLTTVNLN